MNNLVARFNKTIFSTLIRQVILVILAMFIATVVLLFTGYKPIDVFKGLSHGIISDFGGTVSWTIPLILCGLAIAITFRVGIFNLGVDGQLMLSSIAATAVGLYIGPFLPPIITILLAFLVGILVAVVWALIPGFLLIKWGTDEIVTTLMLNFIAVLFTDYLVLGPMKGKGAAGQTSATDTLNSSLWLPKIFPPSSANIGLFIAILMAILLVYLIYRTKLGYEFKIVGGNPLFAKYGGIRSKKVVLLAFAISGMIAGLAGVIQIYGVIHRFPMNYNPGLGFDGVVVALLAQNHPIGVLFSGLLFGALRNGAINMARITDVPRAMVDIVKAVIILAVTAQFTLNYFSSKRKKVAKIKLLADLVSENKDIKTGAPKR